MSGTRILVVEDDESIQELIRHHLTREGYAVTIAGTGEEALVRARKEQPRLVLLDLMLPGMDGLEVCRSLRLDPVARGAAVIMVTAKGEEADIVTGLELGADDYLVKPFSPKVLVARIHSVLRRPGRAEPEDGAPLSYAGLVIHPGRHEVTAGGARIELTNLEFRVLHFLARRPGWVFTRHQIVNGARGEEYPVTDRAVDVVIVGLRRKLGKWGSQVETVRGVGYRFCEAE